MKLSVTFMQEASQYIEVVKYGTDHKNAFKTELLSFASSGIYLTVEKTSCYLSVYRLVSIKVRNTLSNAYRKWDYLCRTCFREAHRQI